MQRARRRAKVPAGDNRRADLSIEGEMRMRALRRFGFLIGFIALLPPARGDVPDPQVPELAILDRFVGTWDYAVDFGCWIHGYYTDNHCTVSEFFSIVNV